MAIAAADPAPARLGAGGGGRPARLLRVRAADDTVQPSPDTFPKSIPVMKTYDKMQKAFPGGEIPATIVVRGDMTSPAMTEALGQLAWRAPLAGLMRDPVVDVNEERTVARISIPILGDGSDATSTAALRALREEIVPATIGSVADVEYAVGGYTAASEDFNALMRSSAPWVFAFVLVLAFLLLLVTFRSIVIAIKAILLNLLSVSAAYGVLVIVFQHGIGKGLLGFEYTGGIDSFLPVFLFVILFGLSMDYHVFILSRIRESFDSGMSTDEAVAHGIKTTASVVTSAALVMVGVFAIFATLSLLFLKQFGVGLAAAILIDATLVRAVLLPATMKLLGDWNWYRRGGSSGCRGSTTARRQRPRRPHRPQPRTETGRPGGARAGPARAPFASVVPAARARPAERRLPQREAERRRCSGRHRLGTGSAGSRTAGRLEAPSPPPHRRGSLRESRSPDTRRSPCQL